MNQKKQEMLYELRSFEENLKKLGYTFDGWKQLDYWFDLVVELGKKGKKRGLRRTEGVCRSKG